ncbi:FAD-dependent oxidoreductase [Tessaracoccus flavus]|uniref:Uncharacterized protein n=1 Tax=Tessaracoccus flavus TaxID=1610493 RepID=A0A1Q2CDN4_9ACTN|nr:FAD-dependent oxidoreductase [Tessaracoccus flavus]AQP44211.1 hypothetical protein RPIT_04760 [Tessaracoccus flavus]SDY38391.1 Protoporphyrinogen oxidase [Tessaracoccus flavus]
MDADVVIIGAGVAGLNAARVVKRSGATPVVLESSQEIGGRVRTELVDGFKVDVGFQVLNPGYPALRKAVDLGELGLRSFGRGVCARTDGRLVEIMDPSRAPWRGAAARLAARDPRAVGRLALWLGDRAGADVTLSESLDKAKVHGFWRSLLEGFLAGVIGDDSGSTSASFTRGLVGWFLLGTPGLPAQGMAALPARLAERSGAQVRRGVRVTSVSPEGSGWVVKTDGDTWRARSVIIATDPWTAVALAGGPSPAPARGLATWWFDAPVAPTRSNLLHLEVDRRGPVVNTAVVSNAQPSYAPAGRHLVQASTLWREDRQPTESEVRRHAEAIYGSSTADWRVVAAHVVRDALTPVLPGREAPTIEAGPGLYVATDAGEASLQGALRRGAAAGERAAAWTGANQGPEPVEG